MDEDTLRARADLWRRRAAEAPDPRQREASVRLADEYEALLAWLLDCRARPAPPEGEAGVLTFPRQPARHFRPSR